MICESAYLNIIFIIDVLIYLYTFWCFKLFSNFFRGNYSLNLFIHFDILINIRRNDMFRIWILDVIRNNRIEEIEISFIGEVWLEGET